MGNEIGYKIQGSSHKIKFVPEVIKKIYKSFNLIFILRKLAFQCIIFAWSYGHFPRNLIFSLMKDKILKMYSNYNSIRIQWGELTLNILIVLIMEGKDESKL